MTNLLQRHLIHAARHLSAALALAGTYEHRTLQAILRIAIDAITSFLRQ